MTIANKFHLSRRMFVITASRVYFASTNTTDGHKEWFDKEGWTIHDSTFLEANIRGFVDGEGLYFYRGEMCDFSAEDLVEVKKHIRYIQQYLQLSVNMVVYGGMQPGEIGKKWTPRMIL